MDYICYHVLITSTSVTDEDSCPLKPEALAPSGNVHILFFLLFFFFKFFKDYLGRCSEGFVTETGPYIETQYAFQALFYSTKCVNPSQLSVEFGIQTPSKVKM